MSFRPHDQQLHRASSLRARQLPPRTSSRAIPASGVGTTASDETLKRPHTNNTTTATTNSITKSAVNTMSTTRGVRPSSSSSASMLTRARSKQGLSDIANGHSETANSATALSGAPVTTRPPSRSALPLPSRPRSVNASAAPTTTNQPSSRISRSLSIGTHGSQLKDSGRERQKGAAAVAKTSRAPLGEATRIVNGGVCDQTGLASVHEDEMDVQGEGNGDGPIRRKRPLGVVKGAVEAIEGRVTSVPVRRIEASSRVTSTTDNNNRMSGVPFTFAARKPIPSGTGRPVPSLEGQSSIPVLSAPLSSRTVDPSTNPATTIHQNSLPASLPTITATARMSPNKRRRQPSMDGINYSDDRDPLDGSSMDTDPMRSPPRKSPRKQLKLSPIKASSSSGTLGGRDMGLGDEADPLELLPSASTTAKARAASPIKRSSSDDAMDVDTDEVRPKSPSKKSPSKLKPVVEREMAEEEEEDDIDFLSPKKRKRIEPSHPAPSSPRSSLSLASSSSSSSPSSSSIPVPQRTDGQSHPFVTSSTSQPQIARSTQDNAPAANANPFLLGPTTQSTTSSAGPQSKNLEKALRGLSAASRPLRRSPKKHQDGRSGEMQGQKVYLTNEVPQVSRQSASGLLPSFPAQDQSTTFGLLDQPAASLAALPTTGHAYHPGSSSSMKRSAHADFAAHPDQGMTGLIDPALLAISQPPASSFPALLADIPSFDSMSITSTEGSHGTVSAVPTAMSSAAGPEGFGSNAASASSGYGVSGMSTGAAERLAELQKMLSKMKMPRRSLVGESGIGSNPASADSSFSFDRNVSTSSGGAGSLGSSSNAHGVPVSSNSSGTRLQSRYQPGSAASMYFQNQTQIPIRTPPIGVFVPASSISLRGYDAMSKDGAGSGTGSRHGNDAGNSKSHLVGPPPPSMRQQAQTEKPVRRRPESMVAEYMVPLKGLEGDDDNTAGADSSFGGDTDDSVLLSRSTGTSRPELQRRKSMDSVTFRQSRASGPSQYQPRPSTSTSVSTQIQRPSAVPAPASNSASDAQKTRRRKSFGKREGPLVDVVAYVDVRTADGDEAGGVFIDMLRELGAKVTSRPNPPITHIIYKSGRPTTVAKYHAHPDPKPVVVGIGWVVRCRETGERVPESGFLVDIGTEPVFQKRRKSMEPKALLSIMNSPVKNDVTLKPSVAASIERARRKSLQFAPKIGSPLVMCSKADDESEEDNAVYSEDEVHGEGKTC